MAPCARLVSIPLVLFAATGCTKPIELLWSLDLAAPSVSTPLVTADYIAVGHDLGLSVVEKTGVLRCTFNAHGAVISAPRTDGTYIFFGSASYTFYAIKPDCSEVWHFAARDRIKSDPVVADGVAYFSSYDGHVYAVGAREGDLRWIFPAADAIEPNTGPAQEVASLLQLAAAEARSVRAKTKARSRSRRRTKRRPRRRATLDSLFDNPVPARAPPPPEALPAAAEEAAELVAAPKAGRKLVVGGFSYSSPVVVNGVLYVGNLDGRLYAIDATTGLLRWYFQTGGPLTSSPQPGLTGEALYTGSNDGYVYAISLAPQPDAKPGAGVHQPQRRLWRFKTRDWVNSSPRLLGERLFVGGNDKKLYCMEVAHGKQVWEASMKGPSVAIPALYKNLVLSGGGRGDGAVYAFQQSDGAVFWTYQTGGKIEADPVVVANLLYVASTDGHLYAFEINSTRP